MENNSWKITKKNIFSSQIHTKQNKKKNLRNEFYSFMKDTNKNSTKKTLNFPLNLTLFIRNQDNNIINTTKTQKNKNKFNIKLSSFKPKNINLKKFQIDDVIKLKEKKSLSRNLNLSNNSNSNILNIDSFNSSSILQINKIFDTMRSPRIKLKSLNYTPLNINTKNSPIIINQIGLDNSSTTKLSSKLNNNLSSSSIENDLSLIKNMKRAIYRNLSNINLTSNERKIPPLISSSPTINNKANRKSLFKKLSIKKPLLHEIKKLFQKEVNNFDIEKKNEINLINDKNDDDININREKEKEEERQEEKEEKEEEKEKIENNNDNNGNNIENNKKLEINENNTQKNKFNFNFKLSKDISNKRHISLSINNFRNSISSIKKEYADINDKNKLNEEQDNINNNISENDFKLPNKNKKHSSINIINKKKFSYDISKIKENDKDNKHNNKKIRFTSRTKSGKKSIKKEKFLKIHSKRKTIAQKTTIILNNKYYLLKLDKRKHIKFLDKINGSKNKNQQIESQKTQILLNMKLKIENSINNKKDIFTLTQQFASKYEFNLVKGVYFKEITKSQPNNVSALFDYNNYSKINKNFNISNVISNYLLSNHEFVSISSSLKLNLKRRNAIQFNLSKNESNSEYDLFFMEKFLKKEEETFKRTKSNVFEFNYLNKNRNQINSIKNIISIHDITQKENKFINEHKYINNEIKVVNKTKIRKSITLCEGRQINNNKVNSNILNKLLTKKISSINLKTLRRKKSLRLPHKGFSLQKYSILQMKKFFERNKKNSKKNGAKINLLKSDKDSLSLSDRSVDKLSSKNIIEFKLEETYYLLLNCIMQGLNNNFINYFQRMEKKIDINQQIYDGNTLIIISTKEGNLVITKFLCQQGADVNIQNNSGNTALHYAIANRIFSIVDLLKSHGAREDITNNKGYSPWDCIEHGLE